MSHSSSRGWRHSPQVDFSTNGGSDGSDRESLKSGSGSGRSESFRRSSSLTSKPMSSLNTFDRSWHWIAAVFLLSCNYIFLPLGYFTWGDGLRIVCFVHFIWRSWLWFNILFTEIVLEILCRVRLLTQDGEIDQNQPKILLFLSDNCSVLFLQKSFGKTIFLSSNLLGMDIHTGWL